MPVTAGAATPRIEPRLGRLKYRAGLRRPHPRRDLLTHGLLQQPDDAEGRHDAHVDQRTYRPAFQARNLESHEADRFLLRWSGGLVWDVQQISRPARHRVLADDGVMHLSQRGDAAAPSTPSMHPQFYRPGVCRTRRPTSSFGSRRPPGAGNRCGGCESRCRVPRPRRTTAGPVSSGAPHRHCNCGTSGSRSTINPAEPLKAVPVPGSLIASAPTCICQSLRLCGPNVASTLESRFMTVVPGAPSRPASAVSRPQVNANVQAGPKHCEAVASRRTGDRQPSSSFSQCWGFSRCC